MTTAEERHIFDNIAGNEMSSVAGAVSVTKGFVMDDGEDNGTEFVMTNNATKSVWADNVTNFVMTDTYTEFFMDNSTEISEIEDTKPVSDWLWQTIPPIILFFGLVGNLLTVCVIRRLGLRNQPTLVFIFALAINDTVVLLTGLPRYWINYTFEFDLKTVSNASCKLYYFFIYMTMQYSSWILVGVTTERMVKTYFPFKYRRLFTSTKVVVGLLVTLFVLILVNGHFFFTNGINEYTEGDCGSLSPKLFYFDENIFVFIDFAILSVIPLTIMLVCNIFLVRILRSIQRDRASMMHDTMLRKTHRVSVRMTKMLVVCTFYFLIATAPISVYFILDTYLLPGYEEAENEVAVNRMDIAWSVTYLLQFTNYSVNFYLYTATNDRFSKEMKALLQCKPSLRQMRINSIRKQSSSRRSQNSLRNFESSGLELDVPISEVYSEETVPGQSVDNLAATQQEGV